MFRRILIWFAALLVLSFAALFITATWIARGQGHDGGGPFDPLVRAQIQEMVQIYETQGPAKLQQYLGTLYAGAPVSSFLLKRDGSDVVTGQPRPDLMRPTTQRPLFPMMPPAELLIRKPSRDGRYYFVMQGAFRPDPWSHMLPFSWIPIILVLLCYALALTMMQPVRKLRQVVMQFGRGDLASRARSSRKDEIGELSRTFDQMADRLQTLLNAERRLLQDISHELRSPLARLKFALELARSSPDPQASLQRVDKEVQRLSTLVGELLQVTRAEGDPDSRNLESISLKSFLTAMVEDCRIEAAPKRCLIELSMPEDFMVSVDRELLHRAVENLIRNAIHYSPEGSTIQLICKGEPQSILLQVRDQGPGVPPEDLQHIFQPFYRVEKDRARENGSGVGLGLAITERAVRLHHGDVHAENMNPGLLVELRLPR
jgi:two-component system sensor histidine kinase CpxA